jgi:UDP-glucose 4-epimerase
VIKVFITGGAGFIGSTLVERLLRSEQISVTVYDNYTSSQRDLLAPFRENNRLRVIQADLLDVSTLTKSIAEHELVYHFASNPDISRGIEDPSLDYRQSIQATFNLLEAMRITCVKRLLFTSGSGVYGDTHGAPTPEDYGPLLPISMYGAGKLGAEALISAFANMFGLSAYIFRMANVVGARQTHGVILDFITKLKANAHHLTILGNGKQSKSYIHVEDILDSFEFVMTKVSEPVNVFNVATGDFVTVDEIAKTVVDEMGLEMPELTYSGGDRGWAGDVPIVRIDASKLTGLGFEPKLNSQQAVLKATREILAQ